jgi:hypothetical protein
VESVFLVTGIMGYMQVEIYEDKDHAREDEIAALGGQGVGQNYFTSFYERFKEIREYRRRHPNAREGITSDDPEEYLKEEPYIDFSGEVTSWISHCWSISFPSTLILIEVLLEVGLES